MTENMTTAALAIRRVRGQISSEQATIVDGARHLADTAREYAGRIEDGHTDDGIASRIAQEALGLLRLAASMDANIHALAVLEAVREESGTGT